MQFRRFYNRFPVHQRSHQFDELLHSKSTNSCIMFLDSEERSTKSVVANKKYPAHEHSTNRPAGWNELLEDMNISSDPVSNAHASRSRQDGLGEDCTNASDKPSSVLVYEIPRQNLSLLQESITGPRTSRKIPIDQEAEGKLVKKTNSRVSRSKRRKTPSSNQRRRGLDVSQNESRKEFGTRCRGVPSNQLSGCNEFGAALDLDWRELTRKLYNCFQDIGARLESTMEYGREGEQQDTVERTEVHRCRRRKSSRMMSIQTFQA